MMLDIIANNDWERPIYFTGGSYGDDDFIWMKDYLEVDGLAYKLVPIKTKVDKSNPFDLGRIDSEKLYNKLQNFTNVFLIEGVFSKANLFKYNGYLKYSRYPTRDKRSFTISRVKFKPGYQRI